MSILIIGLLLFLGGHSLSIAAPHWRDRVVALLGRPVWMVIYSVFAAIGLWLIIRGYGLSRVTPIIWYRPPFWLHSIALLLMVPVFPLLLATYLPGRIRTAAKFPMLVAIKCWALAHLLANGMAADVLLFGSFLLWAVFDRLSLKRRPARRVPALPATRWNDAIALIGGFLLYIAFVTFLHQRLFGVAPIP